MNGLTDISEPTNNGPIRSGALSRRMRDWDAAYDTGYDAVPSTLVQRPDSLWIRFDMDPTATGNIGNLLFDVYRVGSTAPVQVVGGLSVAQARRLAQAGLRAFVISGNLGLPDSVARYDRPPAEIERHIASFIAEVSKV